ncbi:MAG: glycosyltransferase family 4 protein [Thermoguttaceae bacterium]|nr:glycosyltransferase family 4 protein [Thermoguttaceae bacterium]
MNVLLVCEFGNLNGAERSLLSTIDQLSGVVKYSAVVPKSGELTEEFRRRNISVYTLDWKSGDSNRSIDDLRNDFSEILHDYKRRTESDFLVHANSLSSSRMTGPVCRQEQIPSLGHIRDIIKLSRQTITDLNCHIFFACVSSATKTYHVNQGVDEKKAVVLYNGVDLSVFYPSKNKKTNAPLKIGTAGQISLRKGMDVFMRAAELLERRGIRLQYEIAGCRQSNKQETVDLENKLKQFAAAFPDKRFSLKGQLPNLSDWLRSLDIYVHTARQEPLGRVLLEAAATGLPVVATDVGGTKEIFCNFDSNDSAALLIPPDDAQAAAAAIETLSCKADLRKRLGTQARETAVTRFSVQQASENLLNLYKSVIQH